MADDDATDHDVPGNSVPSPGHVNASAETLVRDVARIDPKLLEILVCPLTKTRLVYDAAAQELISKAAGLAFPIRNGVPLLIADAGRPLSDEEQSRK